MRRRTKAAKPRARSTRKAAPRRKQPQSDSHLVVELLKQIKEAGLPEPQRELKFHTNEHQLFEKRGSWRFDLYYRDLMLGIECDGGVFSRGRHVRPQGFIDDAEKLNAALVEGWSVLRFTIDMIEDGSALTILQAMLCQRIEGLIFDVVEREKIRRPRNKRMKRSKGKA